MNFGAPTFKVVMAGDEGVGKTCLIHWLIQRRFVEGFHTTVGASVHDWTTTYLGQSFEVKIWDTAGQERYRSLAPIYFRDANAVVVVFDSTSDNILEQVKSWIEMFKSVAGERGVIVIGANKIDLNPDIEKLTDIKKEIKSLYGVDVIDVSAKTGDGVINLFQSAVDILAERSPQILFGDPKEAEDSGNCDC